MSDFKEYIEHGWLLVPIQPGQKGPRTRGWNRMDNCISDPVYKMRSAGLAHAYSGTCAIDVDNYPVAAAWLAERGVDLDALFNAPDAVQLTSGRADHGKLIYSLPEPLASKTVAQDENRKAALDFRCATAAGLTVQDVLPPSIHPDTGDPYKWEYDELFTHWRSLPALPSALHEIWLAELEASASSDDIPDKGAAPDELRELLTHQDPNMSRDDWVRVGMAIHHETNGSMEGLQLWDEWSQGSNTKYSGMNDLAACWRSFHDTPNAVTVGMLRQGSVATSEEFPHIDNTTTDADDPWAKVEQQRRDKFKLVPVDEIAKREPPEWLIEGLVPKADLAMLYGPSGGGKSFIALDLAFSVATGFTWFNCKAHPGPVVWIAAEAAGAMRNRARAYAQARGAKLEAIDLWVIEQPLSLMDTEDANALTHAVGEKKPVLIVVDTLAAASGGANENSGEDMNKVLDNCRRLHDATGALIFLIHHSGKDESRGARGWSGLRAAVQTEFSLTYNPESPIRVMQVTKQRDAQDGEQFPFKLQVVPIEFDDDITSCVVEPLDSTAIDESSLIKLRGTQKQIFDAVYDLIGEDETQSASIQDVYDAVMGQMPAPMAGQRDRRPYNMKRAVESLHERGYITVTDDHITIGSLINEDENP